MKRVEVNLTMLVRPNGVPADQIQEAVQAAIFTMMGDSCLTTHLDPVEVYQWESTVRVNAA